MPLYERDPEGKLIPLSGEISEGIIRAIERYDDEAIVRRLTTGIASQAYIYRYPIQTKTGVKEVIGISADGADEIALMTGNIEILPDARVDKDSDPDYIYGMVRAKDLIRNVTLLGVGRQCKYQIGKGNLPDHDRIDEHAFVKAITKAARNGILHLTSEEIIMKIINTFDKSGRSAQIKPPKLEVDETIKAPPAPAKPAAVPAPAKTGLVPIVTQDAIAQQQERLKDLRMQVHNRFQIDLGIGMEKRKVMLSKKFGKDSLTDLTELELKECLSWVEDMITERTVSPPPPAPVPTTKVDKSIELGFEDATEQTRLRSKLYTMLTAPNQLALKEDEAKEFITKRGLVSTSTISKTELLNLIKETDELIKAKQTPSEF